MHRLLPRRYLHRVISVDLLLRLMRKLKRETLGRSSAQMEQHCCSLPD